MAKNSGKKRIVRNLRDVAKEFGVSYSRVLRWRELDENKVCFNGSPYDIEAIYRWIKNHNELKTELGIKQIFRGDESSSMGTKLNWSKTGTLVGVAAIILSVVFFLIQSNDSLFVSGDSNMVVSGSGKLVVTRGIPVETFSKLSDKHLELLDKYYHLKSEYKSLSDNAIIDISSILEDDGFSDYSIERALRVHARNQGELLQRVAKLKVDDPEELRSIQRSIHRLIGAGDPYAAQNLLETTLKVINAGNESGQEIQKIMLQYRDRLLEIRGKSQRKLFSESLKIPIKFDQNGELKTDLPPFVALGKILSSWEPAYPPFYIRDADDIENAEAYVGAYSRYKIYKKWGVSAEKTTRGAAMITEVVPNPQFANMSHRIAVGFFMVPPSTGSEQYTGFGESYSKTGALKGDEALLTVANNIRNIHSESERLRVRRFLDKCVKVRAAISNSDLESIILERNRMIDQGRLAVGLKEKGEKWNAVRITCIFESREGGYENVSTSDISFIALGEALFILDKEGVKLSIANAGSGSTQLRLERRRKLSSAIKSSWGIKLGDSKNDLSDDYLIPEFGSSDPGHMRTGRVFGVLVE